MKVKLNLVRNVIMPFKLCNLSRFSPQTILEQFMMMNGNLPEYVCVFRDGVGEGQLQVGK